MACKTENTATDLNLDVHVCKVYTFKQKLMSLVYTFSWLTDIAVLFDSRDFQVSLFHCSPATNTSGRCTTPDSLCEKTLQNILTYRDEGEGDRQNSLQQITTAII